MGGPPPYSTSRMDLRALLNPAPPSPEHHALNPGHSQPGFHPYQRLQLPPPALAAQSSAMGEAQRHTNMKPHGSAIGHRAPQTQPEVYVPVHSMAGFGALARDTANDYITSTGRQGDDQTEDPYAAPYGAPMLPSLQQLAMAPAAAYNPIGSMFAPMNYASYQDYDDDDADSVMSEDDVEYMGAPPALVHALEPSRAAAIVLPPRTTVPPALGAPNIAIQPAVASPNAHIQHASSPSSPDLPLAAMLPLLQPLDFTSGFAPYAAVSSVPAVAVAQPENPQRRMAATRTKAAATRPGAKKAGRKQTPKAARTPTADSSHNDKASSPAKSSPGTSTGSNEIPVVAEDNAEKPLVDWKSLEVPESIWEEAQAFYERVKTMREVQNRQPNRMKHAILGALMFILCRGHGYPRTFAEICTAAKVSKREIGAYHSLMMKVLASEFSSFRRAQPSEFLRRWCSVLDLPSWVSDAATTVHDRADRMAIVQGKCPISVSAASLWLVIWCYNHRHGLSKSGYYLPESTPVSSSAVPNKEGLCASEPSIPATQRDVCNTARVVIATLTSVFRHFVPHTHTLVDGLLDEHL